MSSIPPNDYERPTVKAITDRPPRRSGGWSGLIEPMILTWRLFWDGRVSVLPKLIPLAAAAYVISPVDFVPALALGPLGVVDDVGAIIVALNMFIYFCPPAIVEEHRQQLGFSPGVAAGPNDDVIEGSAEINED